MIDRSTLVWLGLMILVGFALFNVKEGVQGLERDLASLRDRIEADRAEIRALRAEWSYLNDPVRIEELTRRHLGFQPVTAHQVQPLETVPDRGDELVTAAVATVATPTIAAPGQGPPAPPTAASRVPIGEPLAPPTAVMVPVERLANGVGAAPAVVRAPRSLLAPPRSLLAPRRRVPATTGRRRMQPVPSRSLDRPPMRPMSVRDVAVRPRGPVTNIDMLRLANAPSQR